MKNIINLLLFVKLLSYVYISKGITRLGIIESNSILIQLCKDAIADAKESGNCIKDQIE